MKAVLVFGFFALSLLTVPPAAAESCTPKTIDQPDLDVYVHEDCSIDVVYGQDTLCFWNQERQTVSAGPVSVNVFYCGFHEPPPPAIACQPIELNFATLAGSYVRVNADCTVDVVLFPEIICVGPWGSTIGQQIGPVYVQVSMCHPPIPIDP